MTSREKAEELVLRYSPYCSRGEAVEYAFIAADECFKEAYKQGTEISAIRQDFWHDVKEEINKL